MSADDLADLITGLSIDPDIGFHSGRIVSWDPATGTNTVDVAGGLLPDLPMLNIGDTVNLAIGDTVGILRYRSTMFIIGRVTVPGSGIIASQAVEFESKTPTGAGFALSTSDAVVVTAAMSPPPWANRALVHATLNADARNTRGVNDAMLASVWIDAFGGSQLLTDVDAGQTGYIGASHAIAAAIFPGTESFDVTGRMMTNGAAWTSDPINRAVLSVSCTYTRTPE